MNHLTIDLDSSKEAKVEPRIMSFKNRLEEFVKPIFERVQKGWREPGMPRSIFYPHMNDGEKDAVPLIIDFVKNDLKPTMDDLEGLFNQDFQKILSESVQRVLSAKINDEGVLVDFFEGTHTVTVTTEKGQIIGGSTNPINTQGEVSTLYKKYGKLTPFALSKSILQWALWLDYRHGNISEGSNYDYLKTLMGKDRFIFLGSTILRVLINNGLEKWLNIGVSGAQASKALLEKHFDEDILSEYEEFGGGVDQIFANLLAKELELYFTTGGKVSSDQPIIISMEDFKSGFGIKDENITFDEFLKSLRRAS